MASAIQPGCDRLLLQPEHLQLQEGTLNSFFSFRPRSSAGRLLAPVLVRKKSRFLFKTDWKNQSTAAEQTLDNVLNTVAQESSGMRMED